MTSAACKRSGVESDSNSSSSSNTSAGTSSRPPFTTKEPERYQWTSVTVVNLSTNQAKPAETPEDKPFSQVFVSRDGDRRREDYELSEGKKVSFLQLGSARYRLLHSKKVYAEIGDGESAGGTAQTQNAPRNSALEKILNDSRSTARYRKIGAEEVNGRMTTKYGMMLIDAAGEPEDEGAENFIWFDESLGVPVKTEFNSSTGARIIVELRDIKLDVDASLFTLPPDYRKVDSKEIDNEMLSKYLLGGDADENDTKAKGK